MNDYTPDEDDFVEAYADGTAGDYFVRLKHANRGIAKLKAEAWAEGYRQGIEDERTANEVQMGVGPNRNNPYREQEEA